MSNVSQRSGSSYVVSRKPRFKYSVDSTGFNDTAIVFIDPQNDVLSEHGVDWGAVGASVTENKTVENMERIFKAAKEKGYDVFISPHYFYPTDITWKMNGPLELAEAENRSFAPAGALNLTGFTNSGADWLERFKPYIDDGKTIVVSPHKVFGPQTNTLCSSCASDRSLRSFSVGCWQTCVSNRICVYATARGRRAEVLSGVRLSDRSARMA
jgi:hypothetical protein